MKWAVIIFSLLTAMAIGFAIHAKANVRSAEDNFGWAILVMFAGVFGFIDFVLIIFWLAIT